METNAHENNKENIVEVEQIIRDNDTNSLINQVVDNRRLSYKRAVELGLISMWTDPKEFDKQNC